jgi:hypothetical protein
VPLVHGGGAADAVKETELSAEAAALDAVRTSRNRTNAPVTPPTAAVAVANDVFDVALRLTSTALHCQSGCPVFPGTAEDEILSSGLQIRCCVELLRSAVRVHQEQSLTYRAMSSFPRSGALGHPLTGRRTVTSERCHSAARCIHPTGRRPGDQLAPDSATTGSTVGGKVAPARHQDQVARRALLSLLDRDREMTHPEFRVKLEAAGFGISSPSSS